MVRAAISVRKFGRGGRAFAPHFRSATRPRHRGLRPDRPLLCGESSARRSGNPGRRRAFSRKPRSTTAVCDRNFDRSPRFPTATSVAKTATAARICFERGAGLSPCARNTMREEIGRDTSSSQHAGHAVRRNRTRSAAGTFSGHRQRSRRICHQKCGCRVSPTTSGSLRSTRNRAPHNEPPRPCACLELSRSPLPIGRIALRISPRPRSIFAIPS